MAKTATIGKPFRREPSPNDDHQPNLNVALSVFNNIFISSSFFHIFAVALRKTVKYSSVLMLLVFAFFFASTNLFTHVHYGEEGRIVHSHPWSAKSHNHTDAQFQTIQLLSANLFQSQEEFHLDIPYLYAEVLISFPLPEIHISTLIHHVLGLRAPPMSL